MTIQKFGPKVHNPLPPETTHITRFSKFKIKLKYWLKPLSIGGIHDVV